MNDRWRDHFRRVCRSGHTYHSREMFDLFLSLIDDGTLDNVRPGFAMNDDWWTVLYSMATERPELACEAIGHWLDRAVASWCAGADAPPADGHQRTDLWQHLDRSGNGGRIIEMAGAAPLAFANEMLPRVARIVSDTARDQGDHLQADPLWTHRSFGSNRLQIHGALLAVLAESLEFLAKQAPGSLDRLLEPYQDRPHDAIAYLVLRAWTAAPQLYADQIASYLAADPRRLKIGYGAWGGSGGAAVNHVSSRAVKVATAFCSVNAVAALEQAIVNLTDDWEARNPRIRGRRQLELLASFDGTRLSATGTAKLDELRRKFPSASHEPPRAMEVRTIGSPIPEDALPKLTDEQWLGAMARYAGVEHGATRDLERSGGELQLAQALRNEASKEPNRFIRLADRMPADLPSSYFDAIVGGVADAVQAGGVPTISPMPVEALAQLIRRVDSLAARPCGRSVAGLIGKAANLQWPSDVLDMATWYALNDPDPSVEEWQVVSASGQPYHSGDPYSAGINSTRGSIAGAVAQLLFADPSRFHPLENAVRGLVQDRSIAVRSCAVGALRATLNVDSSLAVSLFNECVAADPILLTTPLVHRFVHDAGNRNYSAVRHVLLAMLACDDPETVEAASREICLDALDIGEALPDAAAVRLGTQAMRKAAAEVYATNVAHPIVGAKCRDLLRPFFSDSDEAVRAEAATAFQASAGLALADQAELLGAFLDAGPGRKALEPVIRAVEDSSVQLTDLVCRLVEVSVAAYSADAGNVGSDGGMVGMDLSKIVVRLYAQTEDAAIRSRCLSLIDEMESHYFLGLSDELQRLDR